MTSEYTELYDELCHLRIEDEPDGLPTSAAEVERIEKVTGIGGVFFKSKDRKALMEWYAKHLGLEADGEWGKFFGWREADQPEVLGGTVWSAFPDNTQYFGPGPQSWTINYRVQNLDAMLAQLRLAGIEVDGPQDTPDGRFAWAVDSEGNRFELWEPAGQI